MCIRDSRNTSLLYHEIAKLTPAQPTAYWIDALTKADIPVMGARDIADILSEPHLAAVDFFAAEDHPTEGPYLRMKPPVHYGGYSYREREPAAQLGGHGDAIRQALT